VSIIRLIIAGDWHGNKRAAYSCLDDAKRDRCNAVFQVGDFGVTFGGSEWFPQEVSKLATAAGIPVYFIDGNHEDFDTISRWLSMERNEDGHIEVHPNLFYVPRGTVWVWAGKFFAAMGGAASIDRDYRTLGFDYFKEELITAGQTIQFLNAFSSLGRGIDYFFTHDCSDRTPWGFTLVPDGDSQSNRRIMDGILDYVRPAMHFHGHMHKRYEWDNNGTKTIGLNLENERHSRGVLDTKDNSFEFNPYQVQIDPLMPVWK
jgi:hypothetical protein